MGQRLSFQQNNSNLIYPCEPAPHMLHAESQLQQQQLEQQQQLSKSVELQLMRGYELITRLPYDDALGDCVVVRERATRSLFCVKEFAFVSAEELRSLSNRVIRVYPSKSAGISQTKEGFSYSPSLLSVISVIRQIDNAIQPSTENSHQPKYRQQEFSFSAAGQALFAMEYSEQTLDTMTAVSSQSQQQKSSYLVFEEQDIWTFLTQITQALLFLSRSGKSHGDLRSRCVFVPAKNVYKLAEPELTHSPSTFSRLAACLKGLSQQQSTQKLKQMIEVMRGHYLSPEMVLEINTISSSSSSNMNANLSKEMHRSQKGDMFSLGCIILEWMRRQINRMTSEVIPQVQGGDSGELNGYLDEIYVWSTVQGLAGSSSESKKRVQVEFSEIHLLRIVKQLSDSGKFSKELMYIVSSLVEVDAAKRIDVERLEKEINSRKTGLSVNGMVLPVPNNYGHLAAALSNKSISVSDAGISKFRGNKGRDERSSKPIIGGVSASITVSLLDFLEEELVSRKGQQSQQQQQQQKHSSSIEEDQLIVVTNGLLYDNTSMSDVHEEQLNQILSLTGAPQEQRGNLRKQGNDHTVEEHSSNYIMIDSAIEMDTIPQNEEGPLSRMDLSTFHARTASTANRNRFQQLQFAQNEEIGNSSQQMLHPQQLQHKQHAQSQQLSQEQHHPSHVQQKVQEGLSSMRKQTSLYRDYLQDLHFDDTKENTGGLNQQNNGVDPHLSITNVGTYVYKKSMNTRRSQTGDRSASKENIHSQSFSMNDDLKQINPHNKLQMQTQKQQTHQQQQQKQFNQLISNQQQQPYSQHQLFNQQNQIQQQQQQQQQQLYQQQQQQQQQQQPQYQQQQQQQQQQQYQQQQQQLQYHHQQHQQQQYQQLQQPSYNQSQLQQQQHSLQPRYLPQQQHQRIVTTQLSTEYEYHNNQNANNHHGRSNSQLREQIQQNIQQGYSQSRRNSFEDGNNQHNRSNSNHRNNIPPSLMIHQVSNAALPVHAPVQTHAIPQMVQYQQLQQSTSSRQLLRSSVDSQKNQNNSYQQQQQKVNMIDMNSNRNHSRDASGSSHLSQRQSVASSSSSQPQIPNVGVGVSTDGQSHPRIPRLPLVGAVKQQLLRTSGVSARVVPTTTTVVGNLNGSANESQSKIPLTTLSSSSQSARRQNYYSEANSPGVIRNRHRTSYVPPPHEIKDVTAGSGGLYDSVVIFTYDENTQQQTSPSPTTKHRQSQQQQQIQSLEQRQQQLQQQPSHHQSLEQQYALQLTEQQLLKGQQQQHNNNSLHVKSQSVLPKQQQYQQQSFSNVRNSYESSGYLDEILTSNRYKIERSSNSQRTQQSSSQKQQQQHQSSSQQGNSNHLRSTGSGALSHRSSSMTQRSVTQTLQLDGSVPQQITRESFSIKLPSNKVLEEVVKTQEFRINDEIHTLNRGVGHSFGGNDDGDVHAGSIQEKGSTAARGYWSGIVGKIFREEYANGACYEGEMQEQLRSGMGKLVHKNGERYEGEWAFGKMNGFGRYYYASSQLAYEGSWKNNLFDGKGKQENDVRLLAQQATAMSVGEKTQKVNFMDLNSIGLQWKEFDGQFSENQKEGYGMYYFVDGSRFAGNFHADQAHGIGTFIFPEDTNIPQITEVSQNSDGQQLRICLQDQTQSSIAGTSLASYAFNSKAQLFPTLKGNGSTTTAASSATNSNNIFVKSQHLPHVNATTSKNVIRSVSSTRKSFDFSSQQHKQNQEEPPQQQYQPPTFGAATPADIELEKELNKVKTRMQLLKRQSDFITSDTRAAGSRILPQDVLAYRAFKEKFAASNQEQILQHARVHTPVDRAIHTPNNFQKVKRDFLNESTNTNSINDFSENSSLFDTDSQQLQKSNPTSTRRSTKVSFSEAMQNNLEERNLIFRIQRDLNQEKKLLLADLSGQSPPKKQMPMQLMSAVSVARRKSSTTWVSHPFMSQTPRQLTENPKQKQQQKYLQNEDSLRLDTHQSNSNPNYHSGATPRSNSSSSNNNSRNNNINRDILRQPLVRKQTQDLKESEQNLTQDQQQQVYASTNLNELTFSKPVKLGAPASEIEPSQSSVELRLTSRMRSTSKTNHPFRTSQKSQILPQSSKPIEYQQSQPKQQQKGFLSSEGGVISDDSMRPQQSKPHSNQWQLMQQQKQLDWSRNTPSGNTLQSSSQQQHQQTQKVSYQIQGKNSSGTAYSTPNTASISPHSSQTNGVQSTEEAVLLQQQQQQPFLHLQQQQTRRRSQRSIPIAEGVGGQNQNSNWFKDRPREHLNIPAASSMFEEEEGEQDSLRAPTSLSRRNSQQSSRGKGEPLPDFIMTANKDFMNHRRKKSLLLYSHEVLNRDANSIVLVQAPVIHIQELSMLRESNQHSPMFQQMKEQQQSIPSISSPSKSVVGMPSNLKERRKESKNRKLELKLQNGGKNESKVQFNRTKSSEKNRTTRNIVNPSKNEVSFSLSQLMRKSRESIGKASKPITGKIGQTTPVQLKQKAKRSQSNSRFTGNDSRQFGQNPVHQNSLSRSRSQSPTNSPALSRNCSACSTIRNDSPLQQQQSLQQQQQQTTTQNKSKNLQTNKLKESPFRK